MQIVLQVRLALRLQTDLVQKAFLLRVVASLHATHRWVLFQDTHALIANRFLALQSFRQFQREFVQ